MKKFDQYDVKASVERSSIPPGSIVLRPVVVFTRKLVSAITGERKFKCRVTVDGSTVKMQDTSTSNTDLQEIRLLFAMASANPSYSGDTCTADAEQG